MKTFTLLIGLPASGKSTFRRKLIDGFVLSTDDLIDSFAEADEITYDEAFPLFIDKCTALFNTGVDNALRRGEPNIYIDRTNLTPNSRKKLLNRARNKGYQLNAIVFEPPMTREEHEEWNRRLASRPGKTIPDHVLVDMFCNFTYPLPEEGFSVIGYVNTFAQDFNV